jgi:hypothetical protein
MSFFYHGVIYCGDNDTLHPSRCQFHYWHLETFETIKIAPRSNSIANKYINTRRQMMIMTDILQRVVNVICKADADPKGDDHHPLTLEDIQEARGIIKSYEKEVADMQLQRELLMVTEPMNEAAMTEAARRMLMKRKRPPSSEEEGGGKQNSASTISSSKGDLHYILREKKRMRKRPPPCTSTSTEESAVSSKNTASTTPPSKGDRADLKRIYLWDSL